MTCINCEQKNISTCKCAYTFDYLIYRLINQSTGIDTITAKEAAVIKYLFTLFLTGSDSMMYSSVFQFLSNIIIPFIGDSVSLYAM